MTIESGSFNPDEPDIQEEPDVATEAGAEPGWVARQVDAVLEKVRLSGPMGRKVVLLVLGLLPTMGGAAYGQTSAEKAPEASRVAESQGRLEGSPLERTRRRRNSIGLTTRSLHTDVYGAASDESRLDESHGWRDELAGRGLKSETARLMAASGSQRHSVDVLVQQASQNIAHFQVPKGGSPDLAEVVDNGKGCLGVFFGKLIKALVGTDLGSLISPDNPQASLKGRTGILTGDRPLGEIIQDIADATIDPDTPLGESVAFTNEKFTGRFPNLASGYLAAEKQLMADAITGAMVLELEESGVDPKTVLAPESQESQPPSR